MPPPSTPSPPPSPVAEGATLYILTAQAHVVALGDQRRIGHRLGHAPVDAVAWEEERRGAV